MITLNSEVVQSINILAASDCARVRETIAALRPHWIQRHPIAPFYTLGASNYYDIANNLERPYPHIAAQANPVLRNHLGWLYDQLAETLSQMLQAPVCYPEGFALPGFHIFESFPGFEQPQSLLHDEWFQQRYNPGVIATPIHCDTPHLLFNWGASYNDIDFNHPISFTLAIALPQNGAGMYVWDLHRSETLGLSQEKVRNLLDTRDKQLYRYQIGDAAVHSGYYYHQVAPFWQAQPDDVRITLQGHGLKCRGIWQLYW
ncbi:hypothetical protein NC981_19860 [Leptolyngbya sp. DQ-M1]|uniref:hypothetical protein n=1 Tax=Leptolyngbya sp. DQ-M1 TaxID=2933920 RepID=UPI003297E55D